MKGVNLKMKFTKKREEAIKKYLLQSIEKNVDDLVKHTSETHKVTRQTIYKYLKELVAEGMVEKSGTKYFLKLTEYNYKLNLKNNGQGEDIIYNKYISDKIFEYPLNVKHIWAYCFTEMMNNVIDHSNATEATISVIKNCLYTIIAIVDNGIGIFKKIQSFYPNLTIDDIIMELFKGKLTTDSKHHTGEGIFFTSRILDSFLVISDEKVFSHDEFQKKIKDFHIIAHTKNLIIKKIYNSGTTVIMKLKNSSKKTTKEIFDKYSEESFDRTTLPIKNFFDPYPVSRSQAKRLVLRFDEFKEIELDFSGVSEIGQGFADELFVKYANLHPNINLIPTNANYKIMQMISHVKSA